MRRASQRVILRTMPVLIANQNESITTFDELGVAQNFATATIFQKGTPVWSAESAKDGSKLFVMPLGTETELYLNGVLADDVRYEGAAMTEKKIRHVAVVTGGVVSVHTEIMGNNDRAYENLDGKWKAYAIIGDRQLNEYRLVLKTGIREVEIGTKIPGTRKLTDTFGAFCASAISNIRSSILTLKPNDFSAKINAEIEKIHDKIQASPVDEQPYYTTEAKKQIDVWHTYFTTNFPDYADIFNSLSAHNMKQRVENGTTAVATFKVGGRFPAILGELFDLPNVAQSKTDADSKIASISGGSPAAERALAKAFYNEIHKAKYGSSAPGLTSGGFADGDTSMSFAQPPNSNPSIKKRRAIKESLGGKGAKSARGGSKGKAALGPFIDPLAMGE